MTRTGCFERRYDESSTTNRADSTATATECPECGSELVTADAERVCADCGLVVAADRIDRGPEWWSAGERDSANRTGPARTPARHDRGLSTSIGWSVDGRGNTLSGRQRQRAGRLRRCHAQTACQSTAERNERYGLAEVRRMASALGLGGWLRN